VLKLLVARDGIEPPTFSGPPTESPKWFEIADLLAQANAYRDLSSSLGFDDADNESSGS